MSGIWRQAYFVNKFQTQTWTNCKNASIINKIPCSVCFGWCANSLSLLNSKSYPPPMARLSNEDDKHRRRVRAWCSGEAKHRSALGYTPSRKPEFTHGLDSDGNDGFEVAHRHQLTSPTHEWQRHGMCASTSLSRLMLVLATARRDATATVKGR